MEDDTERYAKRIALACGFASPLRSHQISARAVVDLVAEERKAAVVEVLRNLADEMTAEGNALAPEDDWGDSVEATVRADVLRSVAENLRHRASDLVR